MTDSERLLALTVTTNHLVGIGERTVELLVDLLAKLDEPPSSDLPDMLRALVEAFDRQTVAIGQQGNLIETLTDTATALGARISVLRDQIAKMTSR